MVTSSDSFAALLSHCSTTLDMHQPVLLALFLGGLTGSVSHCVVMCSPFVLALGEGSRADKGYLKKLLIPYHMGRITTYIMLGIIAGSAFHLMVNYGWFTVVSKLLLALAGSFFLAAMLYRLPLKLPLRFSFALPCAMKQIRDLASVDPTAKKFGIGMLLGLIPCGLVFAALFAVSSTASPLMGAVGMAAFGLGTVPALMVVGFAGEKLLSRYRKQYQYFTTAVMGLNSIILFTIAGS